MKELVMRKASFAGAALLICAHIAIAQDFKPMSMMLQNEPDSVYAPPSPPREEEGFNQGGVHLDLTVNYLTDYVYRGIERLEVPGHEDKPNLQFDGKMSFDLGKLPHPFVGTFVNVADSDPVSRFQEIRP